MTTLVIDTKRRPGQVYLEIPGKPQPQQRGRAIPDAGGGARVVDPKRSRSWKGTAQVHMQQACPTPLEGPLMVTLLAVFPCPKSDHKKTRTVPRRWHQKANADLDNIAKAALDAGNGVLWEDDRDVVMLHLAKVIAAQGELPKVKMLVEVISEDVFWKVKDGGLAWLDS